MAVWLLVRVDSGMGGLHGRRVRRRSEGAWLAGRALLMPAAAAGAQLQGVGSVAVLGAVRRSAGGMCWGRPGKADWVVGHMQAGLRSCHIDRVAPAVLAVGVLMLQMGWQGTVALQVHVKVRVVAVLVLGLAVDLQGAAPTASCHFLNCLDALAVARLCWQVVRLSHQHGLHANTWNSVVHDPCASPTQPAVDVEPLMVASLVVKPNAHVQVSGRP